MAEGGAVNHLLAGSRDFRPRAWATGSKSALSSDVEEVKDDEGSSSPTSLPDVFATAVVDA